MNNTQFKVGQQFKDSKGTVLTVKKVNLHEYYKSSPDTFYTVCFEFELLEQTISTYIPQFKLEQLIDSGELTEVKKLSAADRMLEEIIKSDAILYARSKIISMLESLINEEKNG